MHSICWGRLLLLAACVASVLAQEKKSEKQKEAVDTPESGLTRCYGKYGCFSVGEPFLSLHRPINLFPLPPDALDVQFLLRTRRNNYIYQRLKADDADSFIDSNFDGSRPTMFIIHGYLENGYLQWVLDLTTELLTKDNYNVVVVDWGQGATPPYTQAVANARLVGAVLADMIQYMQDRYSSAGSDFHLIGYNVGAHIGGYAGEKVKGIGRITGLDPAEPYFARTDRVVRLDPGDAEFVDVIHTGGSSYHNGHDGHRTTHAMQDFGHVDFYPNGGQAPECQDLTYNYVRPDSSLYGVRRYVSCPDSARSHQYFSESINNDCPFYGYACGDYDNFTSGACNEGCGADGSSCAPMGFRAVDWRRFAQEGESVRMYLSTATASPYCRNHYHVRAMVASTEATRKIHTNPGTLVVHLEGSKPYGQVDNPTASKYADYTAGKMVEFLISARDLGKIVRVNVEWRPSAVGLYADHTNNVFTANNPQLLVHHVRVMNLATGERFIFCGEGEHLNANIGKALFLGGECEFSNGGP